LLINLRQDSGTSFFSIPFLLEKPAAGDFKENGAMEPGLKNDQTQGPKFTGAAGVAIGIGIGDIEEVRVQADKCCVRLTHHLSPFIEFSGISPWFYLRCTQPRANNEAGRFPAVKNLVRAGL
jgi:hypothetical protein